MWEQSTWPWGSTPPGIMSSVSPSLEGSSTPPSSQSTQFCLRWNNYKDNLSTALNLQLKSTDNYSSNANSNFSDVTLMCDDNVELQAHRLVLAACSNFFHRIFETDAAIHPVTTPLVILKDIKSSDMKKLLEYIYKGEVNVAREDVNRLLVIGKELQIKGLASTETNFSSVKEKANGSPKRNSDHEQLAIKSWKELSQGESGSPQIVPELTSDKYETPINFSTEKLKKETLCSRSTSPVSTRISDKYNGSKDEQDFKSDITTNFAKPERDSDIPQFLYRPGLSPIRKRSPSPLASTQYRPHLIPSSVTNSSNPYYNDSSFRSRLPPSPPKAKSDHLPILMGHGGSYYEEDCRNDIIQRGEESLSLSDLTTNKRQRLNHMVPPFSHRSHQYPSLANLRFLPPFLGTTNHLDLFGSHAPHMAEIPPLKPIPSADSLDLVDKINSDKDMKSFYPQDYSSKISQLPTPLLNHSADHLIPSKYNRSEGPLLPPASPGTISPPSSVSTYSLGNTNAFPSNTNSPSAFPTNSAPSSSSTPTTGSSASNNRHYNNSSFVSFVPGTGNKPEWKRYKQYSKTDLASAIEDVRRGMTALQASRKYKVPSRTLYDKIKKLGISTTPRRITTAGKHRVNSLLKGEANTSDRHDPYGEEPYALGDRTGGDRDHEVSAAPSEVNDFKVDRFDSRPQSVDSSATNDSMHPLDLQMPKSIINTSEQSSLSSSNASTLQTLYSNIPRLPTTIEHIQQQISDNGTKNDSTASMQQCDSSSNQFSGASFFNILSKHQLNSLGNQDHKLMDEKTLNYLKLRYNWLGSSMSGALENSYPHLNHEQKNKLATDFEEPDLIVDNCDSEKDKPDSSPDRKLNGSGCEGSDIAYSSHSTNHVPSSSDSPPSFNSNPADSGNDSNNDVPVTPDVEARKLSHTIDKTPNSSPHHLHGSSRSDVSPKVTESNVSKSDVSPILSEKSSGCVDSDYETSGTSLVKNTEGTFKVVPGINLCSRPLDLRETISIPQQSA